MIIAKYQTRDKASVRFGPFDETKLKHTLQDIINYFKSTATDI